MPKTMPKKITWADRQHEWDITLRFNVPKYLNLRQLLNFPDVVSLDVENDENTGAFLLLGVYDGKAYYGWDDLEVAKASFKEMPRFVGHNGISDLRKLQQWGFPVTDEHLVWDTQLIGHIEDSSKRTYSLSEMAKRDLRYEFPSYTDICGKKTNKSHKPFTQQRMDLVISKNAADCWATYELMRFQKKTADERVLKYYRDVEAESAKVFSSMQDKGIRIDTAYLSSLEKDLSSQKAVLEKEIKNELGDINLNSPKQLLEALREKEIYPEFKGKPSTDKRAIERLRVIPCIDRLLKFSELETLLSSFVKPYIQRGTDIVHPQYLQTGTRTGRPSCSNPNLLQIPRKTENGKMVRRMFIPRQGYVFGELDYGQIEPRVLAHVSKDPSLCNMFKNGIDFHTYTAERLGITREAAKVLNLSVGYRASYKSVSQQLKCDEHEAQKQIDAWWSAFPALYAWQTKLIWQTKKDGYFTTLLGRRIKVDNLNEYNKWKREHAERMLINNIAQASAAEVMKLGMVDAYKIGINLLVQVYDSLLIEEPAEYIEEAVERCKEAMVKAIQLHVPLVVDTKIGSSWGDMKSCNQ